MADIKIEKNPDQTRLKGLNVSAWPIWSKGVSEFPWSYDNNETCYILEGDVDVTPENGRAVKISKGDLVTFPKGMSCTWKINKPVRKHYTFS